MSSVRTAEAQVNGLWVIWFCICLIPITTSAGIGINYSFVASPLLMLLVVGKAKRPPLFVTSLIFLFTLILVIASIYQVQWLDQGIRRIVSFGIFISLFTFCFVPVTPQMTKSFLVAVILVSVAYSSIALVKYLILGPEALGWGAKDAVGTQRIGFIYIFALWITVFWRDLASRSALLPVKTVIIALIVVGLFLTFSRSSIVALVASALAYSMYSAVRSGISLRSILAYVVAPTVLLAAVVYALTRYFPVLIDFYTERLLEFFISGAVLENVGQADTSEGIRFDIWRTILLYLSDNFVTGTGYLGVWVIHDAGSAHNQFMDTLLRVGIFGSFAYFCLLAAVARYVHRQHPGLFVGLIGALVYGLFHETFKESQGAFVLAFLVGMYATRVRDAHERHMQRAVQPVGGSVALAPRKPILLSSQVVGGST